MDDVKHYPPYLDYPKERKKLTNADKYFRNATDEELAEMIMRCINEETFRTVVLGIYHWKKEEWLDWLKQEVESDG